MKIKSILSVIALSVFTFSTAFADKPVAISKADGPNSLEIGISVDVGNHKIMRNQNNKNTALIKEYQKKMLYKLDGSASIRAREEILKRIDR